MHEIVMSVNNRSKLTQPKTSASKNIQPGTAKQDSYVYKRRV